MSKKKKKSKKGNKIFSLSVYKKDYNYYCYGSAGLFLQADSLAEMIVEIRRHIWIVPENIMNEYKHKGKDK